MTFRLPLYWTVIFHDLRDGDYKGAEFVQDDDTKLEPRELTVELPCRKALTEPFDAVHLRFDAALAVVSTLSSPQRTVQIFHARSASLRATVARLSTFQDLASLRGGKTAAVHRSAIASWHSRVSLAPSAVTLAIF